VSQSDNYVVNTAATPTFVVTPNPQFRSSDPVSFPAAPHTILQPIVFIAPTGDLGPPLTFPPLFEQRLIGNGIRPLGDIFMNQGALSPSFLAQVFTSSDSMGDGAGHGF
ncbi:flagellar hook-length control protein FliK, partial [Pseudomonas antarctica]